MASISVRFDSVSFAYEKAVQPLILDFSAQFPRGWTGVVGANGAGKTTLLKLATGQLAPSDGRVFHAEPAVYCPQRTDSPPGGLDGLIRADGPAMALKGRLGIGGHWLEAWKRLSHGERKRAQIAVALWRDPRVLAVDEPTNHLDRRAREMLFAALRDFSGVGLLVSHDRRLLDGLCARCLFVEPPRAILRPGNYTQGWRQTRQEEMAVRKKRAVAKQDFLKLSREAGKRRAAAAGADQKRSKSRLAVKDHDGRARIDAARVTGKDGAAGRRLDQMCGRLAQARERLDGIRVKKIPPSGIWMPASASRRKALFALAGTELSLGPGRSLRVPDLFMAPRDRIALTGENGSGKSTLVAHIMASLDLGKERVVYLPQEIGADAGREIMDSARGLSPDRLGRMMTIVSRLGSDPRQLLDSALPSPGEIRKVLLATGIARSPHLIVMDEPTNHLDLPSVQCLEQALAHCPCGLLLVSHDQPFLDALTRSRWHILRDKTRKGGFRLSP